MQDRKKAENRIRTLKMKKEKEKKRTMRREITKGEMWEKKAKNGGGGEKSIQGKKKSLKTQTNG